jgi:predicted ArsR family transcriptional regulator
VNEIGERLRLNQPQVSKHLRVLKEAGIVDVQPPCAAAPLRAARATSSRDARLAGALSAAMGRALRGTGRAHQRA